MESMDRNSPEVATLMPTGKDRIQVPIQVSGQTEGHPALKRDFWLERGIPCHRQWRARQAIMTGKL
jgi:hypothetical protein